MQCQYDGELQKHVHALQDECHEHVGQEEPKLRNELTNALTHESQVCKDHEVLSHQEVVQLRGLVAVQQEELRSIHQDCADLQRKSATAEAELQRTRAHEEHALYISTMTMRSRRRTPRSTPCSTRFRACKKSNVFSWKQNDLRLSA